MPDQIEHKMLADQFITTPFPLSVNQELNTLRLPRWPRRLAEASFSACHASPAA